MVASKGTASRTQKYWLWRLRFADNEYLYQLYNRDFIMNAFAYLSRQVSLISVRPREMFASRLDYKPEP